MPCGGAHSVRERISGMENFWRSTSDVAWVVLRSRLGLAHLDALLRLAEVQTTVRGGMVGGLARALSLGLLTSVGQQGIEQEAQQPVRAEPPLDPHEHDGGLLWWRGGRGGVGSVISGGGNLVVIWW